MAPVPPPPPPTTPPTVPPPPIAFPPERTCFTIAEAVRLLGLGDNWRNAVNLVAQVDPPVPFEMVSKSKLYNRAAVLQIQNRFIAHRLRNYPDKPLPWDAPKGRGGRRRKSACT